MAIAMGVMGLYAEFHGNCYDNMAKKQQPHEILPWNFMAPRGTYAGSRGTTSAAPLQFQMKAVESHRIPMGSQVPMGLHGVPWRNSCGGEWVFA